MWNSPPASGVQGGGGGEGGAGMGHPIKWKNIIIKKKKKKNVQTLVE